MGTRAKETTREFFFPFVRPLFRPSPLTEKATAPNPSPLLRHRPFCSQFRSLAGFPFHLIPQQETSSQAEVSPVLKIKNLLFKLVKFADSVSLCSLAPLVAVLYMNAKKKKKTKGEKKPAYCAVFSRKWVLLRIELHCHFSDLFWLRLSWKNLLIPQES